MKKIKIAMFSVLSVHAEPYISSLPLREDYEWVAISIEKENRRFVDLKTIPSYVKIYETPEELLDAHPDLDAVVLTDSNDMTYSQFKLCAERGIKNLLLMKIPSMNIEEYEEMQRIAKEKEIIIQIELELLKDQTVRHMKQLYDSGAIGKLLSINISNTTVCLPPELKPWVTDPKRSYGRVCELRKGDGRYRGGCLTDHPHPFYLSRFLADSEFESIYADVSENFRDGRIVEEGVFVIGKMKNGVSVSIDPSYSRHENKLPPISPPGPGWEGYPKRVETEIVLNGEKGSIFGDCFHSGVYHTGLPYNTFAVEYLGGRNHYTTILNAFYDSVLNRTVQYTTLDTHKNNIIALTACYESIYTGKKIIL